MENQIVRQIQLLKQIKPRQDWVVLTKNRILQEGNSPTKIGPVPIFSRVSGFLWETFIFGEKLAFGRAGAATFAMVILMGLFGFAKTSAPGDALYPVKRAILQGESTLFSGGQAVLHLKMAADSAYALKEAAKANNSQKIAAALQEYKENISKAAVAIDKEPKDTKKIIEIASMVNQLQKDIKEAEGVLQTEIAKEETKVLAQKTLEDATSELETLLARELQSLANSSLTEGQRSLLEEAQTFFNAGDYAKTMEYILRISNQK